MAALARLRLDPEEAERMARDMSSILEYMAVLGAVAPEPEPAPRDREEAVRSDGARAERARQPSGRGRADPDRLALPPSRFAPEWKEGFFVVPRLPGVAGRAGEPDASS